MLRWRRPIAWLGVAGLSAALGWVWQGKSFETASWAAGVLALFVALAPEVRRFTALQQGTGSAAEQVNRAADDLAAAVLAQWDAEEKTRRLQDPWPLPVNWTNTTRPVVDHWEVIRGRPGDEQPMSLDGEVDQIVEVFDQVPSRRLVVLGSAGSGKSVLMLRLTLGLLGRRAAGQLVPVLLHLSTWSPGEQRLHDWLVAQLIRDYPELQRAMAGTTVARELVTSGLLLPVLDGM
jgi:predicted NACHT family NTPase